MYSYKKYIVNVKMLSQIRNGEKVTGQLVKQKVNFWVKHEA